MLERLYENGEYGECLKKAQNKIFADEPEGPEKGEILALIGWCYYRQQKFESARESFQKAGEVPFAREGLLYLAAYAEENWEEVKQLSQELGDRVNVQNTLTICARHPECHLFSHRDILEGVFRFEKKNKTVEMANLYHNAARFFLAKLRGRKDLIVALGLLEMSLSLYGISKNWHHRGAVNFWKSKILKNLSLPEGALQAARISLDCWTQQVILDPGTKKHRQQWENAIKRIKELLN